MIKTSVSLPEILYEDEVMVVVSKPAGMVVNRAETVRGTTLQDWVEASYSDTYHGVKEGSVFRQRSGIAHRLDKETSGVMLIAKTERALDNLMEQFRLRRVNKTYLALAHGKVEPKSGYWWLPIKRLSEDRQKFGVDIEGKMGKTDYQVEKYLQAKSMIGGVQAFPQGFSLLKLFPKTGRTHQIRVHLRHMQAPIVADRLYLGKKLYQKDKDWCPRHFLHAAKIEFSHPVGHKRMTVEGELPQELENALNCLTESGGKVAGI